MNNENTAIRLKRIMKDKNLRQIDVLNMALPFCSQYDVKMNKSDISQYCAGKTEPNQKKLFVLGKALNVSEAWLMGFDVPMERVQTPNKIGHEISIQSSDHELLNKYNKLNSVNKRKVIEYSESLYRVQLMEEENNRHLITNAAHERTDIEVTEEMKKYDDAFFDE